MMREQPYRNVAFNYISDAKTQFQVKMSIPLLKEKRFWVVFAKFHCNKKEYSNSIRNAEI